MTDNKLADALRGIIELGKRDLTSPKYDGYFDAARAALAEHDAQPAPGECNVEGSWLWRKLMDWCKQRGIAPATQNALFAIAGEAHKLYAAPKPAPAPAADGAGELPPLPNPQVPFIGCDLSLTDICVLVGWYKRGATDYARAAIAALRHPVPDEAPGIARAAAHIQKKADDYAQENCSSEPDTGSPIYHFGLAGMDYHHTLIELAEEVAGLALIASQQESRNGSEGEGG